MAIADSATGTGGDLNSALLSFPYGLSQPLAVPKLSFVTSKTSGPLIVLDQPVNTGESGSPLVTLDGKVLGFAGSGKDCIPISAIRSLIQ